MINVDTTEVQNFVDKLREIIEREVPRGQESALDRTGDRIIVRMRDYPPETAANSPHAPYYYKRGTGTILYPSGRVIYRSQNMREQWRKRGPSRSGQYVEVEIRNDADYSSYTHGLPGYSDPSYRQARFHTRNDWPPLPQVAMKEAGGQIQGGVNTVFAGRTVTESEFEIEAERIAAEIERIKGA